MKFKLLEELNSQQKKAVTYKNKPLLILAGAGSGKTKALTYRAAYLILKKDAQPEEILLVTFTNKAAEEMKRRMKGLVNHHSLPFAGTFHSFCARILRKEGKYLDISPSYLIYDKTDQRALVKEVMKKLDLSPQRFKPEAVLAAIADAKNELIGPQEYLSYARGYFQETVARTYLLYQNSLAKYQALDFSDLIFKTVALFRQNSPILEKYQNLFRHILVDEYHDTNHAQYELTKLLAKKRRQLAVVADCSQSIYGWRGADFRNVLRLKKDFPQLKTINLEQNYRSSKTILRAAFQVIKRNNSHPVLKLWTKNKGGEKIKIYRAADEKEEAGFIVQQIQSAVSHPEVDYSNFAILYRTNAQSRVLEEALLPSGLPYVLVGGVRFYERKEIKDVLAYLRLLINPQDQLAFKRAEKLGKTRLKKFLSWQKKFKIKGKQAAEILKTVLQKTDYWQRFDKKNEKDLARIENIKELFSVCAEFPQLTNFLENVALVEEKYLPPEKPGQELEKNAVTLMTIHAAKGLEFETVFLAGLEEGLFPHSRSLLEKEKLEEERRLAYVGITRAKRNLFLTYSRRRLYFGRQNYNQVSRFIAAIPNNLLQFLS